MLIKQSNRNKDKSKYQCDMCKKYICVNVKNTIYVAVHEDIKRKKYDLCDKCYKIVCRNIDIWNRRKTNE